MQFILPTHRGIVELHKKHWEGCTRCPLHCSRSKVVLWKGYVPCDMLLIGEAPGFWEDNDGFPFVGPAGGKLDELLGDADLEHRLSFGFTGVWEKLKYAITNIVCCLPPPEGREAIRTPKDEEAQACSERLREFVKIAQPKVIVHVGEISATQGTFDLPMFQMLHPSALLQTPKHIYTVKHRQSVALLVKAMERCRVV